MEKTIYTLWNTSVEKHTDLPAIRWLEGKEVKEISYGALNEKALNVKKGLAAKGFSGAHLALIGVSSVEWMQTYLGITTGGNVAIPLDILLPPKELIELLVRSDSEGVFLDPRLAPLAPAIKASCPKIRGIWFFTPVEGAETVQDLADAGVAAGDVALTEPLGSDIATIVYTSGTTGKSKGVLLTQENLYSNVEAIIYNVDPGVVFMSVLPIHHAFCLVMDWMQAFWMGAVVCINDSFLHMVRNMSIFKPDVMLMVPLMIETIYKRLKAAADPNIPPALIGQKVFGGKLKHVFTGGAHLEPFYIDEFAKYGVMVLEGYGMSECSPVISSNRVRSYKPGSIGRPLPGVEISFADNGEILVKSASVMKGYYKMEEETNEALKDGWLHTGDKGYMDEDGFLFINGRVKNLIILSNGENVSPEEIEGTLCLNDLIEEVVVMGEGNGLTAHIYASPELTEGWAPEKVQEELQKILDKFNEEQPSYRRLTKLVVRKNPFIKNATRKILRHEAHRDEPVAPPAQG